MTSPRRNLLNKRTRQWLLLLHVIVSVGWLGAGAANVVLAVTAARTEVAEIRKVCYLMINRLDFALVIPLAFGTLVSGLAVSLLTRWGLLRHWWVLIKFILTMTVIIYSTFGVGVWVEESMAATATNGPSPVAGRLAIGAGANIIAFLFMSWASIRKPWGLTRWGRRPNK